MAKTHLTYLYAKMFYGAVHHYSSAVP